MGEKVVRTLPRTCVGRISCLLTVLVPMMALLAVTVSWMYSRHKAMVSVEERNNVIRGEIFQLGQLIMDINEERGLTLLYMTARSPDSQASMLQELSVARQLTDQSMGEMTVWPGSSEEGEMFRSYHLFAAVLDNTRTRIKPGDYYRQELDFYTNIIDTLFGWLTRKVAPDNDRLWRWLVAYGYLMASINYMGAEQALCGVFHSVVCFSHRDTFRYANYSFSGEAAFRLYRQTYPEPRQAGWRVDAHHNFFPQLSSCRNEIIADMGYVRISVDPSSCDFVHKNETRVHETALLSVDEQRRLRGTMDAVMKTDADSAVRSFLVSVALFAVVIVYYATSLVSRCVLVRATRKRRRWKATDVLADEDKIVQLTATPTTLTDSDNHDTGRHGQVRDQNNHDTMLLYRGTVPQYHGTLPQYHGTQQQNHGTMPQNHATMPKNSATLQNNHRNHGIQQHNQGTLLHSGFAPNINGQYNEMIVKVATV